MAILATRRRWLVTSLWAATRSPCSRQRLASIYSSCGSSIGNRRISSRYRDRPDSAVMIGKVAAWAMTAPSLMLCPRHRQAETPDRFHRAGWGRELYRSGTSGNLLRPRTIMRDDHTHLSRAKTSMAASLHRDGEVTVVTHDNVHANNWLQTMRYFRTLQSSCCAHGCSATNYLVPSARRSLTSSEGSSERNTISFSLVGCVMTNR